MMKRLNRDNMKDSMETFVMSSQVVAEKKRITWVVRAAVMLDGLCYWMQLGIIPYLTRTLGVDTKTYGYLQSVFAFIQLFGGPLFGRFGDLVGGKYALILAYLASFTSYGLLAIASNIPLLFLSRLPSCAMHCMQGCQMLITDITSNEERAGAIGLLGVSYGIGIVIGPLLGGYITDKFSPQAAACTSAFGAIICIFIILLFIPANTKKYRADGDAKGGKKNSGSIFDFQRYFNIFKVKNFTYLFVIKVISCIPSGIFQAMYSLCAMDYFQLEAKQNGMVLSYIGITGMMVQGFGVKALTKRFSDAVIIKYSIVIITIANFLLIFATNIYVFLLVLLPLSIGGVTFGVVITSNITKTVPADDTGTALGLSMSIHSFIRTLSPTIGGILYSSIGFSFFGISGFMVHAPLTIYLYLYGRDDL